MLGRVLELDRAPPGTLSMVKITAEIMRSIIRASRRRQPHLLSGGQRGGEGEPQVIWL